MESGESVEKITPQTKGKTVLVPLTGSMYVPGTIIDTDNVIIDIGTGYYAQKVSIHLSQLLRNMFFSKPIFCVIRITPKP